jgi:transposase
VIITERVDDVALLIGQMVKMGLPEVLDRHIPRHWTQRGISWGWTAVIWLAYIVTEGDHRKVSVETYLKGMLAPREARNLGSRRNPMKLVVVAQEVRTLRFKSSLTKVKPTGQ